MDRLTSLTAFVRVVDNGGFSAAGRRLNMSTTMVSNHVQALEERLGARLLQRTTRKVSLTEVGKAYYDRATQILADLEQADDIAGAPQSTPRGTLRIYTATHIVQFVAPVVAEFLALYHEVKVDLTIGEKNIDMIDEGYRPRDPADAATRFQPDRAQPRDLASCAVLLARLSGKARTAAAIAGARQITIASATCIYPYEDEWRFVDRKGTPASVRVSGNLISNSGDTLRRAALQGVGILPGRRDFWSRDDLDSGRLVRLLPEYRPVEFAMNAVYPHRHHLSAKVRTFIDHAGASQRRTAEADQSLFLSRLRLQDQLLHAPVQELADVEHVLRRAGDRVDPAELLQLLAGLAEHAEHLAVERQLVDAARARRRSCRAPGSAAA